MQHKEEQYTDKLPDPFKSLFTKSSEGIVILDEDGTIRFLNPAAIRMFKKNKKELIGSNFGLPMVDGDRTIVELIGPQNRLKTIEMTMSKTQWEGQSVYLTIFHDITDKLHTQTELEKIKLRKEISEKKFYKIFHSSPDPIVLTRKRDGLIDI